MNEDIDKVNFFDGSNSEGNENCNMIIDAKITK